MYSFVFVLAIQKNWGRKSASVCMQHCVVYIEHAMWTNTDQESIMCEVGINNPNLTHGLQDS